MHITKLILIFLFIPLSLTAQIKPDIKKIDEKTYNLYMSEKWDELTEAVDDAINNGVDFYYLRMRAGIAYYQAKNYMSAIPHFEKALEFSPSDSIANEYLYYSYLFSGRDGDARILSANFPLKLKEKLEINEPKFFNGVYIESGYTFNMDFNSIKKSFQRITNNYNEQTIIDDQKYFSINLTHYLGNRLTFFQGYNFININSIKQISGQNVGQLQKEYSIGTNQNEYYFNMTVNLGKGFEITTALHYLNVKVESLVNKNDTLSINNPPVYFNTNVTLNDFVSLLSLSKSSGKFKLTLANSLSNLNEATQVQNTFAVIFFPAGNLNFYTVSSATLLSQRNWGSEYISYGLFDQKIGFKVFDKLWTEANYTFGNITNFNESNGFVVFNNIDIISNRFGLNLIFPLSKFIEISLRYQYFNQQYPVINYTNNTEFTFKYLNYKINKILGGIKWTF